MQVIRRVGLIGDLHAEDEALKFAIRELRKVARRDHIDIGVIAVPAESAQPVLDLVVAAGGLAVRDDNMYVERLELSCSPEQQPRGIGAAGLREHDLRPKQIDSGSPEFVERPALVHAGTMAATRRAA